VRPIIVHQTFASFASSSEIVGAIRIEIPVPATRRRTNRSTMLSFSKSKKEISLETARIAGVQLMPKGDVPSRAPQEPDSEDHVLVVCPQRVQSMNATVSLRQHGFEKARSMGGG
jgi:hypothetical protein